MLNAHAASKLSKHPQFAPRFVLPCPCVPTTTGKNTTNPYNDPNPDLRRKYFSEVFDKFTKSVDVDDGLRGVAYWMFDPILQNENSPGYEDFGQDQVGVRCCSWRHSVVWSLGYWLINSNAPATLCCTHLCFSMKPV
jgi:hypothetical protein